MSPRALISVYDKTGVEALAQGLEKLGWEIVASVSTGAALEKAGVRHTRLADLTGFAEMLDHRVVTLHPAVHGGILADRSIPQHMVDLETHGITPIDLVVVNLYPFRERPGIETIDIGGPTMVRAAAKNHAHVGVVVDPGDYGTVLDELRRDGALSEATRRRLARAAFAHTAAYDAAIVTWFDQPGPAGAAADGSRLPRTIHLALERAQELRYGENPHQEGARYREVGSHGWWDEVVQHFGLPLSYLNIYDADAAWAMVHDLGGDRPCAVIVKHANPCGVAVADDLASAYQLAFECDEQSAFGGIVAVNRPVDTGTVERMVAAAQADVVIAPGYGDGVVDALRARRRNTRVLQAPPPARPGLQVRQLNDGYLVQEPHRFDTTRDDWRVVTKVVPTEAQWRDAELAWRICGHVKSNAIVLVKNGQAVGIGAGQQKRVDSGEIAARKAAGRAKGGAFASDAFFPFRDGVDPAAEAGAAVVIQPGGAMRDDEVVAAADELGLAMVFTGERHFLH
ncbi:MAG TPA: bifunctional phosphoribosylaminoimidazolecarboxamide formyltransferase/IMP cyclohydrolase [Acidimicrobiales bacterium]|nr:bifunctional phosphoribosylaminoimidazolecarboxamide formyltransferase/IMP cyclohydrolase [Acidimicrobiales bacterium]